MAFAVEAWLRPELQSQPWSMLLGAVFPIALWFRSSHPLGATATAFGLAAAVTLLQIAQGLPEIGPYMGLFILLLPYALCRWGARRDVLVGVFFMAAAYVASLFHGEMKGVGDVIGGAIAVMFPGAIGATMRFRAVAQERELDHAKLKEREQLARELHDSVAHHMTAITIQAQAARAVVATRPEAASAALKAIEEESRRTLAELRAIVGALRDDDAAALAPQGRVADIASFARDAGATPAVLVELTGNLDGLPPVVERALYRLAQESITNAVKHAHNATRIEVRVAADTDSICLSAQDNGDTPSARRNPGFGLVGMAERAALLGGTFEAGPHAAGGWRVQATLPRKGGTV